MNSYSFNFAGSPMGEPLCLRPSQVYRMPFDTDSVTIPASGGFDSLTQLQQQLFAKLINLQQKMSLNSAQFSQLTHLLAGASGVAAGNNELAYYIRESDKGNLGMIDQRVLEDLCTAQYDRINRCIYVCDSLTPIVDRTTAFSTVLEEVERMLTD